MSTTLEMMSGILRDELKADGEPRATTTLAELELDSLDFVNFLFKIEELTGVEIPDEDIEDKSAFTLGELAEYVDARR